MICDSQNTTIQLEILKPKQSTGISRKVSKFKGVKLIQVGLLSLVNVLHVHVLNKSATEWRLSHSSFIYKLQKLNPYCKQWIVNAKISVLLWKFLRAHTDKENIFE